MTSSIFSDLNDKQREAVFSPDGPVLVLAGAGSGKTRVIAYRIGYLLKEKNVSPYSILAVTFTNKASTEMKERVLKLLGKDRMPFLWIGTFHSICARILREDIEKLNLKINRHFTIFDKEDSKSVIKKILKDEKLGENSFGISEISDYFSLIKRGAARSFPSNISSLYSLYEKSLVEQNALDFDDLLLFTVKLLREVESIRVKYQQRFQHILVDEYQDTNDVQEELLTILAEKWKNLFLVGDEDQSIYGFRGSKVRHIVEFPEKYSNAKIIRLEKNYRSFDTILSSASALVSHNKERLGKTLWTDKKGGEKIKFFSGESDRDEANFVADEVLKLSSTYPHNKIAILMRTNSQSRGLEETFLNKGIPYQIVGGIKFYERKEVKDIISYLRLAINPYDRISLLRVINTPPRGIGKTTIEAIEKVSLEKNITLYEAIVAGVNKNLFSQKSSQSLKDFMKLIKDLQFEVTSSKPSEATANLIEKIGYINHLESQSDLKKESRVENIKELVSAIKEFEVREGGNLEMFLERQSLSSDQDELDEEAADSVKVMTIHSAKGLEFPVVFIVGLEDGFFPHEKSKMKAEEVEEERRLLYVGMTRAMERLYFTNSKTRYIYGNVVIRDPSPFLSEIPFKNIEEIKIANEKADFLKLNYTFEKHESNDNFLRPGIRVYHKNYGVGIVLSSEGSGESLKVTVSFSKFGRKKLLAKMANLEVM